MSRIALAASVTNALVAIGHTVRRISSPFCSLLPPTYTIYPPPASFYLPPPAQQIKGIDTFPNPAYRSLPTLLRAYAKVGWYQGSAFFAILSLYTYQLSQRSPETWTGIDRMIVGSLAAVYWASSAWYFKHGDGATGGVTGIGGAVMAATLLL